MSRSLSKLRWSQGWRRAALASTALSVVALAAPAAVAATTPPAANSLPGNFSPYNGAAANYTLNSGKTNQATIDITTNGTSGTVLDFNGNGTQKLKAHDNVSAPTGATQNSGFSVGNGAGITVTAAIPGAVLLNDTSGNPSQIYGSVTDTDTGASLFIDNANGVVVGASGSFDVTGKVGLLGYGQSDSSFDTNGDIEINSSTKGTGDVTVANGVSFATGEAALLVAGNGAINVAAAPTTGLTVLAGYGYSATAPVGPSSALTGSTATVTISGGSSAALTINVLDAAGDVTNAGVADYSGATAINIAGTFSNTGTATVPGLTAGAITNSGVLTDSTAGGTLAATNAKASSGANITNNGKIVENGTAITFNAGSGSSGATGNFVNNGVVDFNTAGSNSLTVNAANIDFAGNVQQQDKALTSSTPIAFKLSGGYWTNGTTPTSGVIDYASTIYANSSPTLSAQAVRILSGSLTDPTPGNTATINVGAGKVPDPFANGLSLGYNLSLFPNTALSAPTVALVGQEATSSAAGSMMNLGGVVGNGSQINVTADTINATPDGGFALKDLGTLSLTFSGNVNDPNGAMFAGATAFQYNDVPVRVANEASGKAGTATITFDGPSATGSNAQFVNLLVSGNVTIENDGPVPTLLPGSSQPISARSSATNNHLVVQATGNVEITGPNAAVGGTAQFYWPGLTYLSTVTSASAPTTISDNGSITLGSSGGSVALNNILPSFITGGGGVYLETNNLNLNGANVSTSNNSWVNFASGASAYAKTSGKSFFGAYKDNITSTLTQLGLQQLPSAYFVDRLPQ